MPGIIRHIVHSVVSEWMVLVCDDDPDNTEEATVKVFEIVLPCEKKSCTCLSY